MENKLNQKEKYFSLFTKLVLAIIGLLIIISIAINPWFLEYQEYMGWRVGEKYWLNFNETIDFLKWLFNK